MADSVKPESTGGTRSENFPVRWTEEEFSLIKQAADLKAASDVMSVTPTDIIRSGTIRYARDVVEQLAAGVSAS